MRADEGESLVIHAPDTVAFSLDGGVTIGRRHDHWTVAFSLDSGVLIERWRSHRTVASHWHSQWADLLVAFACGLPLGCTSSISCIVQYWDFSRRTSCGEEG